MGCIICKEQKTQTKYIRVVHWNGHVEDFYYPLTSFEVTGNPPNKQFLCTQSQLMSGYIKPLKPETQLEPSQVYFMLSYSTIQSESSPIDLAITTKRLIRLAKKNQPSPPSSNSSLPRGNSPASKSPGYSVEGFGQIGLCKGLGSWKPILDTIRESSFNRRSESELREMRLEIII